MLKHDFKLSCPLNLKKKLCNEVSSLKDFMHNINQIILNDHELIADHFMSFNVANCNPIDEFKGAAFEIFIEYLLKVYSCDPRIGIAEYNPWDESEFGSDWGVDGIGRMNGFDKTVTVQCKYRANKTDVLEANRDHISNFVAYTMTSPIFRDSQMYIFTTCKGLSLNTNKNMYHDSIIVFGHDKITKLLGNNNTEFWSGFYDALI